MTLKQPFKGSDRTTVNINGKGIKLIQQMLENTQIGGEVVDVGDSLDDYFADAQAGDHDLSHDQLALLLSMIKANRFYKKVRKDARVMADAIQAGVKSFYHEEEEED